MSTEIKEMTEEEVNALLIELDLCAINAGFKSGEEMDNFKVDASSGMIKFGGGFTHFLGHALARADRLNTVKIINAFRSDCEHHAELHKKFMRDRFKEGVQEEKFDLDARQTGE